VPQGEGIAVIVPIAAAVACGDLDLVAVLLRRLGFGPVRRVDQLSMLARRVGDEEEMEEPRPLGEKEAQDSE
jgi:hypothetical protein